MYTSTSLAREVIFEFSPMDPQFVVEHDHEDSFRKQVKLDFGTKFDTLAIHGIGHLNSK